MAPIFVTFDVFHEPMFWLKADAEENIPLIFVTFDVFQVEMFWLKVGA